VLTAVTQPTGGNGTGPVNTQGQSMLGRRMGWLNGIVNNCFTGQMGLAVSYKGSDSTSQNTQPQYFWACTARWVVAFKSSLLG